MVLAHGGVRLLWLFFVMVRTDWTTKGFCVRVRGETEGEGEGVRGQDRRGERVCVYSLCTLHRKGAEAEHLMATDLVGLRFLYREVQLLRVLRLDACAVSAAVFLLLSSKLRVVCESVWIRCRNEMNQVYAPKTISPKRRKRGGGTGR